MTKNVIALVPRATYASPLQELEWMFNLMLSEKSSQKTNYSQAKLWYFKFVNETQAGYSELKEDPRFFIESYWEYDALIRFASWISKKKSISSNTRYSIYKCIRTTMHYAYQLNIINTIVYHAPFYKGTPETDQRAPYSQYEQEIIDVAIGRTVQLAESVAKGYEKTGKGKFSKTHNHQPFVDDKGKKHFIREASEFFNIPIIRLRDRRVAGWTDLECLGLADHHNGASGNPKPITINGKTFKSESAAAKFYNVNPITFNRHLKNGASPEQAAKLEPHTGYWDKHDVLLYDFENSFNCDPLLMLCESTYTKSSLKTFFRKIGVWAFIDSRLILPLAAELARLTALNAESIASLNLDSYQERHPLTNQPTISYTKVRGGSENTSEDKILPLSLLEVCEVAINDSVSKQVHDLIALVKELTAKIRPYAHGSTADKLFIYEHDLWNIDFNKVRNVYQNFTKQRKVTSLFFGQPSEDERKENPHSVNASVWARAFIKDHKLNQILGKNFKLNISRFRSSLANSLIKEGAVLFDVQVALGHGSVMTTNTYLSARELEPEFPKVVKPALEAISKQTIKSEPAPTPSYNTGYTETLCGTGCKDAFNPSDRVRKLTKHVEGSLCKYWNMCLLCEQSTVTENALPKIIAYKYKLEETISEGKQNTEGRKELYEDIITVINGLIEPDGHFPGEIIQKSRLLAMELDDEALDYLVYQGAL